MSQKISTSLRKRGVLLPIFAPPHKSRNSVFLHFLPQGMHKRLPSSGEKESIRSQLTKEKARPMPFVSVRGKEKRVTTLSVRRSSRSLKVNDDGEIALTYEDRKLEKGNFRYADFLFPSNLSKKVPFPLTRDVVQVSERVVRDSLHRRPRLRLLILL